MRIRKDNAPDHSKGNELYNRLAGVVVSQILQTESEAPTGYLPARSRRGREDIWQLNPATHRVVREPFPPAMGKPTRFEPSDPFLYEHLILTCLAHGDHLTYVMTGAMGSGKSATIRYVLSQLRLPPAVKCGICERCSPVIVHVNFNKGFNEPTKDATLDEFQRRLYTKLREELHQLLEVDDLADHLVRRIRGGTWRSEYDSFRAFARTQVGRSDWAGLPAEERALAFTRWIEAEARTTYERLELAMELVALVKAALRPDPACFVLVLDNIDSVVAEAQYPILSDVLSLASLGGVKVLIALRHSTFHRLRSHAAYPFSVIQHLGPGPLAVAKARFAHFLRAPGDFPGATVLPEDYQRALRARVEYVLNSRGDPHGVLARVGVVAGDSVRLGLDSLERCFVNGVTEFASDPGNRDEAFRAVLLGKNQAHYMAPDDRNVANLFLDYGNGGFSLLNLRMLQLVAEFEGEPLSRSVHNLAELLQSTCGCSAPDILTTLNYLLSVRRPLLWIDGRTEYGTVDDIERADDVVYATASGRAYLSTLVRELVYVEEAMIAVAWSDSMPAAVDFSKTPDRFALLRTFLGEIVRRDFTEVEAYAKWSKRSADAMRFAPRLLSNRMLASIGEAAVRILGLQKGDAGAVKEATRQDWRSLVTEALNYADVIGDPCQRLRSLGEALGEV